MHIALCCVFFTVVNLLFAPHIHSYQSEDSEHRNQRILNKIWNINCKSKKEHTIKNLLKQTKSNPIKIRPGSENNSRSDQVNSLVVTNRSEFQNGISPMPYTEKLQTITSIKYTIPGTGYHIRNDNVENVNRKSGISSKMKNLDISALNRIVNNTDSINTMREEEIIVQNTMNINDENLVNCKCSTTELVRENPATNCSKKRNKDDLWDLINDTHDEVSSERGKTSSLDFISQKFTELENNKILNMSNEVTSTSDGYKNYVSFVNQNLTVNKNNTKEKNTEQKLTSLKKNFESFWNLTDITVDDSIRIDDLDFKDIRDVYLLNLTDSEKNIMNVFDGKTSAGENERLSSNASTGDKIEENTRNDDLHRTVMLTENADDLWKGFIEESRDEIILKNKGRELIAHDTIPQTYNRSNTKPEVRLALPMRKLSYSNTEPVTSNYDWENQNYDIYSTKKHQQHKIIFDKFEDTRKSSFDKAMFFGKHRIHKLRFNNNINSIKYDNNNSIVSSGTKNANPVLYYKPGRRKVKNNLLRSANSVNGEQLNQSIPDGPMVSRSIEEFWDFKTSNIVKEILALFGRMFERIKKVCNWVATAIYQFSKDTWNWLTQIIPIGIKKGESY